MTNEQWLRQFDGAMKLVAEPRMGYCHDDILNVVRASRAIIERVLADRAETLTHPAGE